MRPYLEEPVTRRRALACCGAGLIAYVGVCHEVVGSTLMPYGPAVFGGALGWHAAGASLVGFGLLMVVATLGVLRVPVVPLGAAASTVGWFFVVLEASWHGNLHFFALTLVVAGALVGVAAWEGQRCPLRLQRRAYPR